MDEKPYRLGVKIMDNAEANISRAMIEQYRAMFMQLIASGLDPEEIRRAIREKHEFRDSPEGKLRAQIAEKLVELLNEVWPDWRDDF